jgi:hypothetical protein
MGPTLRAARGWLSWSWAGIRHVRLLRDPLLLSGWVEDWAKRRGIGTDQASSAYPVFFYLGSTIAGVAANQQ